MRLLKKRDFSARQSLKRARLARRGENRVPKKNREFIPQSGGNKEEVMGKKLRIISIAFLLLAGLNLTATLAHSQAKYGAIEGRVLDAEGEPLPGVEVKGSSPDLIGGVQSRVTDDSGKFRFPALSPGTYILEASLQGFVPAKKENIRLFVGQTLTVDLTMKVGTLQEEVTVIGVSPLVDVKDSQVNATNLDEKMIKDIAAAGKYRNATQDLLNLAPGIQDASAAGSAARVSVQWQIDGTNVSYIGSGADWTYPDINMVEEAQVAGFGANAEYGGFTGAVFNTVLKSGGNNFEGLAEVVYSGLGWRNKNIDTSDPKFSLYEAPPRQLSFQAHLGIGGPIIKDKLWYYVGGGQRQDDEEIQGFKERASSQMPNGAVKLTFQPDPKNRFHALAWFEDFLVYNRGLSVNRPVEASYFDVGPDLTLSLSNLHTFSDNTYSDVRVGYFWCLYDQRPNQGRDVSQHFDAQTGMYSGNYGWWGESDTSHISINASLSHHADNFIRGAHDFKVGVEFLSGDDNYSGGYPGGFNYADNVYSYYDGLLHNYAYSYSYGIKSSVWKVSAFAQDSWRISDRLTVNPGVRYSHYRGKLPTVSSSPVFTPQDAFEPRIGLTWDILGDHSTAFKIHYGRYYDSLKCAYFQPADQNISDWVMYEVLPNGEKVEIYRSVFSNPTEVDPNIRMPKMDQFTIGLERTLLNDLAVGASFIYRDYSDFIAKINTTATWATAPFTFLDENGVARTIEVYNQTSPGEDDRFMVTNPKAGMSEGVIQTPKNKYRGFSIYLNKRFSSGWMLHAHYAYGRAKGNHDNTYTGGASGGNRYLNPNRQINAEGYLPNDPTHVIKVYGTFQLPWGFSLSPQFMYETGYNWTRYVTAAASGRPNVFLEKRGSNRLPAIIDLGVRLEKNFNITQRYRLGLIADIFNTFNRGKELQIDSRVDSQNFGKATWVTDPRSFRASLRFFF
jgi:hypothetical protein